MRDAKKVHGKPREISIWLPLPIVPRLHTFMRPSPCLRSDGGVSGDWGQGRGHPLCRLGPVRRLRFLAEAVTEAGPVAFYNATPIAYGITCVVFALAWFARFSKTLPIAARAASPAAPGLSVGSHSGLEDTLFLTSDIADSCELKLIWDSLWIFSAAEAVATLIGILLFERFFGRLAKKL